MVVIIMPILEKGTKALDFTSRTFVRKFVMSLLRQFKIKTWLLIWCHTSDVLNWLYKYKNVQIIINYIVFVPFSRPFYMLDTLAFIVRFTHIIYRIILLALSYWRWFYSKLYFPKHSFPLENANVYIAHERLCPAFSYH